MKMPVNFAILKYFTKVKEACADDIMEALGKDYEGRRDFNKKAVIEALMTAEANALLEETRFDQDSSGELRVYYRANEDGKATINKYIKDRY